MRRLLLVFLAILLPLQFAWAGAAAYCAHEKATSVDARQWHFGHHTHEHKAADSDRQTQDAKDSKSAKLPDGDCNACHFPGSHGLFSELAMTGDYPFVTVHYQPRTSAFGSIPSPVPDRPQWSRLA
ncbi:cation efflux protein, CzcI family [Cupriavidus metallidurans]|uniref:cation efflux protein, CzcI family n=1 Tax=Cupriavidus metallidurans TaxID=119219 RepID=UPI001CCB9A66|nr:cation efflux protein, CzcI family [Cupriavidus metallidurans]UBM07794.1 heavy metal resistance regulator [Cupriavidus metallidurans]